MRGQRSAIGLIEQVRGESIAISAFTYAELLVGELRTHTLEAAIEKLDTVLAGFERLPIDERVIERYAMVTSGLFRRGTPIAVGDILIAATAIVHQRTLVTRNLKHFTRIAGLGLFDPADKRS